MQANAMLFSVAFAALFSAAQAGVVLQHPDPSSLNKAPPGSGANPWPAGTTVEHIKAHQALRAANVEQPWMDAKFQKPPASPPQPSAQHSPASPPMPSAADFAKEQQVAKQAKAERSQQRKERVAEAAEKVKKAATTKAEHDKETAEPDMEKEDMDEIENQKAENDMADEATSLLHDGRGSTESDVDQDPAPKGGDFTFKQDPTDYAKMWKLADEKAEASEKKQKELEARLDDVEQKKIAVNTKLRQVDRTVASDQKHHDNLVAKHKDTDKRNAKAYLTDADKVVSGKIELKEEKRARLQEAIDIEKKFQAGNEAKQKKKQEEKKVLGDKKTAQEKQKDTLMELKRTETKLNQGVRQSQTKRISDITEKIGLDTRGIEALTNKLAFEESQEAKLTKKLGEIVHNDEEVSQVRKDLVKKTQQLSTVESDLAATKAKAAKDLKDCEDKKKAGLSLKEDKAIAAKLAHGHGGPLGHGSFLAKATAVQAPEMQEDEPPAIDSEGDDDEPPAN